MGYIWCLASLSEEVTPKNCKKVLQTAENRSKDHSDALIRARAEVWNKPQRAPPAVEDTHQCGLKGFLNETLPVKDSLE